MKRLRPKSISVVPGAQERLRAAARALETEAVVEEAPQLMVQFGLGGTAYAVELSAIDRAITQFGEVIPLPGAPASIRGTAFLDGVPHVVADLLEAAGHPRRALDVLERSPALVVHREGVPLAIAVEGPLELTEVAVSGVSAATSRNGVGVAAKLPNGALLLATDWLRQFIAGVA